MEEKSLSSSLFTGGSERAKTPYIGNGIRRRGHECMEKKRGAIN